MELIWITAEIRGFQGPSKAEGYDMKLGRVAIPVVATIAVVFIGVVAVALVANGVLASEPSDEPEPTATPVPATQTGTQGTPSLDLVEQPKEVELVFPEVPPKAQKAALQTGQTGTTARTAPPPQNQGQAYTWEDGDRTLTVLLQEDLTVQKTSEVTASDVVLVKGAAESIIERQPQHGTDDGPVFKSESGGGLMTLPGGVLLALNPEWDQAEVDSFFADNGITPDLISELGFIENGFLVETDSGFPSLNLANELASQNGVLISSPNWSREVEAK